MCCAGHRFGKRAFDRASAIRGALILKVFLLAVCVARHPSKLFEGFSFLTIECFCVGIPPYSRVKTMQIFAGCAGPILGVGAVAHWEAVPRGSLSVKEGRRAAPTPIFGSVFAERPSAEGADMCAPVCESES